MTILSLLKRLLNGEEKHEALFDEIINGFHFLVSQSFSEKDLKSFEQIIVLRILHMLGYIGKVKELEIFLKNEWSMETLMKSAEFKKKIVGEINQALKESML